MKQKATYQQLKCDVITLESDAVRTSNPSGDHFIPDVEDWGTSTNNVIGGGLTK